MQNGLQKFTSWAIFFYPSYKILTPHPDLFGNPDFENSEIRTIRIFAILGDQNCFLPSVKFKLL